MKSGQVYRFFLFFFLCLCLCLGECSCSNTKDLSPQTIPEEQGTKQSQAHSETGTRDSSPVVLTPRAEGTKTYKADAAVIDVSHTDEGYIMADYSGDNHKPKLQLTGPDGVTYTYDMHGGYETFPLTAGDGSYQAGVYENISGTRYANILSADFTVSLKNEFGPYLYPNQYVNFTEDSLPVLESEKLSVSANSDLDVVSSVYNYIIDHFTYDYSKAESVKSGYLPDVDSVFTEETGICFDYASVMASMLRSQKIPTRLEVGYMEENYHAWISTYIKDKGWINGIIEFDGKDWKMMDPTYASTSSDPKKFIPNDSKYTIKYVY